VLSVLARSSETIRGGTDGRGDRQNFASASVAALAAEGKPNDQVVRFVAQADRRELQAFNRDVTVTMDLSDAVDIDSISLEGSIILPIQRLGRLLADSNTGEVRITRVSRVANIGLVLGRFGVLVGCIGWRQVMHRKHRSSPSQKFAVRPVVQRCG
jgi:hypothetical protein